ncbi:ethylene-responsive transcription factor ERF017-like [Heracleum sosnowskyi]|uniref:Ethylene-responsive transcription factor ERF017-like n=1 Tax=Heracleum sosnowskyi TaxID=360622 RepID=A0AAD8I3K4_9APIA|nr:ethylene-responsive transcription factor ERF017-like [Heracleum sosnowskyi]
MENSVTPEMNSSQATSSSASSCKYKGVRFRKWGKYVSEIRLPNSRERIWLGSYDSAVKAARAFDAAQFCLRGPSANFNFPDNLPDIPGGRSLTPAQIQIEAARFAHSCSDPQPVSNNLEAEVQQQTDHAPSNADQAGVETSLLDEFKTMSWESESVSEYGYFQGFDNYQNELFLSGPNYVNEEVDETSDESFTTNGSFLWNF